MSATCINVIVDNTTLIWVDGALTTVTDEPAVTRNIYPKYAACGGFKFDANVFKLVDKILTLKTATASPVPVSLCGSSFVDGNVFSLNDGILSLNKTDDKGEDPAVETVTITYKDGADGAVFDDVVKKVAKGETTPAYGEADPVRENYTFKGWNPTVAGKATADATYTATWEKTTE